MLFSGALLLTLTLFAPALGQVLRLINETSDFLFLTDTPSKLYFARNTQLMSIPWDELTQFSHDAYNLTQEAFTSDSQNIGFDGRYLLSVSLVDNRYFLYDSQLQLTVLLSQSESVSSHCTALDYPYFFYKRGQVLAVYNWETQSHVSQNLQPINLPSCNMEISRFGTDQNYLLIYQRSLDANRVHLFNRTSQTIISSQAIPRGNQDQGDRMAATVYEDYLITVHSKSQRVWRLNDTSLLLVNTNLDATFQSGDQALQSLYPALNPLNNEINVIFGGNDSNQAFRFFQLKIIPLLNTGFVSTLYFAQDPNPGPKHALFHLPNRYLFTFTSDVRPVTPAPPPAEMNSGSPFALWSQILVGIGSGLVLLLILIFTCRCLCQKIKKRRRQRRNVSRMQTYVEAETGKAPACTICLEDITEKGAVTSCDHKFHQKCLAEWMLKEASCPVCRKVLDA